MNPDRMRFRDGKPYEATDEDLLAEIREAKNDKGQYVFHYQLAIEEPVFEGEDDKFDSAFNFMLDSGTRAWARSIREYRDLLIAADE